ncbi:uncharacterized protein ISCGN_019908 [Ixodes scapularis]
MSGSEGAVSAAHAGRGIRASDNEDYQVMLPPLPTGSVVLNTVFLHADMKGRPYRIEDFRDALVCLGALPEVSALGAYQMNHVWAVTFKTPVGKKRILETPELTVKGRRCVVVDPCHQDIRVKLHWLLFNVPDDDVRAALAPYGKVTEVAREKWRVDGCQSVGTMTRTAVLRLKAGVTLDDIPHQLRVGGELALVVVPGRAPLCLRCQRTGHIRKECRVPRCSVCRRFGHEGAQCVRSYAAAAAPVGGLEKSELLMDEAETEEAAKGSPGNEGPAVNDSSQPKGGGASGPEEAAPMVEKQAEQRELPSVETLAPPGAQVTVGDDAGEGRPDDVPMADADASAGSSAAKRAHDDDGIDPTEKKVEPPSKAAPMWRRRGPFKPDIPAEDRRAAKPPP